ncbi:SRSO17 transposase [Polaromonas sp. CG_9.7]|uniref:IS701 family transposase n=1 Tax=Polaromonas sp. CG_23.6 TaxID=2760709 RepID=UPI001A28D400|nr:IS701 family transposase [Polaromonas sp. CG_23.6]MBG6073672.1 SRSO17 transposase [Polaromonas sp. CG_9.7]MDH6186618.1 SRSO17 transposase [Polaromonas sp. CG_23.6]
MGSYRPAQTALVGAEPMVQAQAAEVQRLQFFLSEAAWDAEAINAQRLALLVDEPATAPAAHGVLIIDDTGDRKDGSATDHVARQYLGSVGKIDNGIVAVTTLWADEARYYPLHVAPYTPAVRLAHGKHDAAFHTKPQIALELVERAQAAGIAFSSIVADCFYGDDRALEKALLDRRLPHVLARRGAFGRGWAPAEADHSFADAAEALPLSAWREVTRRFRDGHTEHWWAAELTLFGYGPDQPVRAVCATTNRRALPALSTWYLTTNLSREQAPLGEVVRLYGLRNWARQSYKQMKDELGWADFMVRSDRAIRRHWTLVCCAFAFCWWHAACQACADDSSTQLTGIAEAPSEAGEKNRPRQGAAVLAAPAARGARLADPGVLAGTLLGRLCQRAPAGRARRTARRPERRPRD